MRNTERRSWSIGDIGIRLVIFGLAAVLLLALQITGQLKPVQSFISQLTSPAQAGATGVAENTAGLFGFVFELFELRQRNSELVQRNASLLAENFTLSEVEQENQRLRQLLSFAQTRPGLELRGAQIVGRVIGAEATNFLEYLILDLGQRHGIEVGMPVVTDQGLVGRISEVDNATSKVLLITDSSSQVNSVLQSSRLNGIVRGDPSGALLMDFIPQGAVFSIGEVVLTSGIGGKFPRGVPIGQVVQINQRDIDVFQQAVVQPTVNFDALELVAVVTNFDPLEIEPAPEALPGQPAPGQGETPEETPETEQAEPGQAPPSEDAP